MSTSAGKWFDCKKDCSQSYKVEQMLLLLVLLRCGDSRGTDARVWMNIIRRLHQSL